MPLTPRAHARTVLSGVRVTGATIDAASLALLRRAQRDPSLVLLEGMHALKHAVRFGARVEVVASPRPEELAQLLARLAPDLTLPLEPGRVEEGTWQALVGGRALPSPCLAVARRPDVDVATMLGRAGRLLVLEDPRHLGNIGAVVRVAAAADLAGVLVVGDVDPWHPTVVRAAAGLHFAVDVARLASLDELWPLLDASGRPLVALDPSGEDLEHYMLGLDAAVALGTERGGLSDTLLARSSARVAIPMRVGVSSLNLATAAAVVAYRP
jgi:RNA methyltransferase, TrmH family